MNVIESNIIEKVSINKTFLVPQKITVNCTKKFNEQVSYLCEKISNVEWSGILFYSVVGIFPDITINLECVFPMHKGTSGATEYVFNEEVVNFMMENPETMDYKIGHIHSHNNMAVFFSGTDISEMEDNVINHVYYLSVIVNNRKEISGRVAILSKVDTPTKYPIKNDKGEVSYIVLNATESSNYLFYWECLFNGYSWEEENLNPFQMRVSKIIQNSYNRSYSNTGYLGNTYMRGHSVNSYDKGREIGYDYEDYYRNTTPNKLVSNTEEEEVQEILSSPEDLYDILDDDTIFDFLLHCIIAKEFEEVYAEVDVANLSSVINATVDTFGGVKNYLEAVESNFETTVMNDYWASYCKDTEVYLYYRYNAFKPNQKFKKVIYEFLIEQLEEENFSLKEEIIGILTKLNV